MHVVRHYHISANGDVEFPLSVGSKSYESAMHVILREPFSMTVSAKGDEVERPRVKEPLQTGWPPRKVSLHEKSCIAKQSSSSSTVSCSHRPVAHHRSVPVATGLRPVCLTQQEERPAGPWLQQPLTQILLQIGCRARPHCLRR